MVRLYSRKRRYDETRNSKMARKGTFKNLRTSRRFKATLYRPSSIVGRKYPRTIVPELKYTDRYQNLLTLPVQNTIAQILLNNLNLGSSSQDRVGQRILMKSVNLKAIFYNQSTALLRQTVRIMLLVDRQCDGGTFTNSDLLQSTTNCLQSHLNVSNASRFTILMDSIIPLVFRETAIFTLSKVVKIPDFVSTVVYASTNIGSIADISSNALFFCMWTNVSVDMPKMSYAFRTRFYDA